MSEHIHTNSSSKHQKLLSIHLSSLRLVTYFFGADLANKTSESMRDECVLSVPISNPKSASRITTFFLDNFEHR